MLALAIGTLLAVGALAYVLLPLIIQPPARRPVPAMSAERTARIEEQDAVLALREIEFDRVTGKLSDSDYAELKARYTERALAAMRGSSDAAESARSEDPVEAAVRAYRARIKSCAGCGPRPEPDATYCSSCGVFLSGRCADCGAPVSEPGAAFCSGCGRPLAA